MVVSQPTGLVQRYDQISEARVSWLLARKHFDHGQRETAITSALNGHPWHASSFVLEHSRDTGLYDLLIES